MNFGEKLTSLRKQKGLSQEELGEALNVTRQTISKWELDQTSPDSSKLIEIAKFFNIGVNELTSEEEIKIENTNEFTTSEGQKKSAGIIVLIIVLIICLVGIVFYATKLIIGKSISNIGKGIFNKSEQLQNESKNIFTNIVTGAIKEGNNSYNEFEEEFNKDSFNSSLELYVGTEGGSSVGYLLDKVVTSNKKNSTKIITVIYKDKTVTEEEEIISIKHSLDKFTKYEVSLDYDENGYVNRVTIKDI